MVAEARNTLGHLHRAKGENKEARREYEAALSLALSKGIRRLESDVLSELSRLSLQQGDAEAARTYAMRSLSIANECGLGLRQCHSLIVLGLATDMIGDRQMAIGYLKVAHDMCVECAYWHRKQEIETFLREWGDLSGTGADMD